MATYDEKIVYGKDLVPYGQKLVDKIKSNIVDNLNSNETNKFLSANQGKILNETKLGKTDKAESSKLSDVSIRLQTSRNIIINGDVSGRASFDGTDDATISTTLSNIDASKITSGTIDIARLPKGALERVIVVANDEARFALTKSEVQNGDTVKVTQTLKMYFVKDDNQLSTEGGYEEYTAGKATAVDWTGIEGKPESFPPTVHNQTSNTINAMTGYTKTGSGAISTSDSLNVAIGKLEVALDGKEPKISKQSGFNLPKSDAINEANSSQLATSLAVKTAYDKSMEALNKATTVEQSVGSKLDKGEYNGTANDLKGLIEDKLSKSGDTMTGTLIIKNESELIKFNDGVDDIGKIYSNSNKGKGLAFLNLKSGKFLFLDDNGDCVLEANNLQTSTKEVVGAINELNSGKLGRTEKANSATTADTCTGNSATATKLQTARTINGVAFDGTDNITVTDNTKLSTSGGTISGNLTVTGQLVSNNEVTAYSDIRLKEDIEPITNALDKVLELNGYTFKMKGNNERSCGVIAQEVEKVLPEVIRKTDDGYLSVAYANIVGLLIEAIKEQQRQINELRGDK